MKWKNLVLLGAFASNAAMAGQIVLSGSNVIGGTASYFNEPWNSGPFQAQNIFNNQTGPAVAETFRDGSYWLATDQADQALRSYILVDLGASYRLDQFSLFNTHNGNYFDRGTGNFRILGGNAIAASGYTGFALSGATKEILAGTLAAEAHDVPVAQDFSVADSGSYRYFAIEFLSAVGARGWPYGEGAYGLNELKVYGETPTAPSAVPEPASGALAGLGMVAMLGARRSRRAER